MRIPLFEATGAIAATAMLVILIQQAPDRANERLVLQSQLMEGCLQTARIEGRDTAEALAEWSAHSPIIDEMLGEQPTLCKEIYWTYRSAFFVRKER